MAAFGARGDGPTCTGARPPDVGGLRRGWTNDRSVARTMRHRSGFHSEAAGSVCTNACSDGSCTYR